MQSEIEFKEQHYTALNNYYKRVQYAFETACINCSGKENLRFKLAEQDVLICTAGRNLRTTLCRAFSHLPITKESGVDTLEMSVWDVKESGVELPSFPWHECNIEQTENVFHISSNKFSVFFLEKQTIFQIYHTELNRAIICVNDAKELPTYFMSSPFFRIIQLWSKRYNLNIIHAGCVADENHAVLFVGKGGKGKSTSSIQCLIGGLNYIGDDYILVKYDSVPIAYSIYCTGKVHSAQLKKFPQLEQISINSKNDLFDKPLVYLNELFKEQVIYKSPIKAIIVPNVTSNETTQLTPISSFEALKAMAPSTLIQLNLDNDTIGFSKMAKLVKTTPAYRLDLGAHIEQIGSKITELLNIL